MDTTTRNEEQLLFARMRADGGSGPRDEAVRRYLPLARSLAHRYRRSSEPIEDLEQVACIGLLKAIDRYDPERGVAFSSFAVPTILGELRRHFRDRTWAMRVPRELQELTLRIERARDDLTASLGRQPTMAELSELLDVSEELILSALELVLVHDAVPLSGGWDDEDDGTAEESPGAWDDGFERAEDRATLAPLLSMLPRQEAEILLLRFHDDLTQDAIAQRVGVSQMHVSRVLYRSLAHLREAAH